MNILYVTDLHGDAYKYEQVFRLAVKHGASAVVSGGDMLPILHRHERGHWLGTAPGVRMEEASCPS